MIDPIERLYLVIVWQAVKDVYYRTAWQAGHISRGNNMVPSEQEFRDSVEFLKGSATGRALMRYAVTQAHAGKPMRKPDFNEEN